MTGDWAVELIGGAIFFVIGALFVLFVQPRLEMALAHRRQRKQLARSESDARFAAQVAALAADPHLFAATFRAGVGRIVVLVVGGVFFSLVGLVMQAIPFPLFSLSGIPFVIALWQIVPAAATARNLYQVSEGVRNLLSPPGR
jgi:hypothetical protein